MKIVSTQRQLLAALGPCLRLAKPNSPIPAFGSIKVDVSRDGVTFSACDGESWVTMPLSADTVSGEGEVCIPVRNLEKIVGAMADPITLAIEGPRCAISGGGATVKVEAISAGDFPVFQAIDEYWSFDLSAEDAKRIGTVAVCTKKDRLESPAFFGVCITDEDGFTYATATDKFQVQRFRLSSYTRKNFSMPPVVADAIQGSSGDFNLHVGKSYVIFDRDGQKIVSPRPDAMHPIPNLKKGLSMADSGSLVASKGEVLAAARLAMVDADFNRLVFSVNAEDKEMTIESKGLLSQEAKVSVPVNASEDAKFALNGQYVIRVLSGCASDDLRISWPGERGVIKFKDESNHAWLGAVLTMAL